MQDEESKGKPVALDPNAISASAIEPAFVARPKGAPVYYGFLVLEDVSVEGFTFGAITDFEAAPCDAGDAFVVAPDGSRAGLVWEVSPTEHIEEVSAAFRPRQVGGLGSLVPIPYGQPRQCSKESRCSVTQIESPLGAMEAVACSPRVGSTVVSP